MKTGTKYGFFLHMYLEFCYKRHVSNVVLIIVGIGVILPLENQMKNPQDMKVLVPFGFMQCCIFIILKPN
jgi:hypothetical protein